VEKEGEGKWATILKANPEVFLDRSAVDLKDKWRNLKGRSTRTARKRVNGLDAPLSGRALALAGGGGRRRRRRRRDRSVDGRR
jgi:hypothetical protein